MTTRHLNTADEQETISLLLLQKTNAGPEFTNHQIMRNIKNGKLFLVPG